MAAPMVLYPQTNEQHAVARRVSEIGAGVMLRDDSAAGIRAAVRTILQNDDYARAAAECSADFRSCTGAKGAADHIEQAPHDSGGRDVIAALNKAVTAQQILYNVLGWILFRFVDVRFLWIYIAAVVLLSAPVKNGFQRMYYQKLISVPKK